MKKLETLLTAVEAARKKFIREARGLHPYQSEFKPAPEVWSVKEIVEHIVWAERVGGFGMWKALEAVKTGATLWKGTNCRSRT